MNGLVSGGWSYVIAAYGLSALILGGYAVRTVVAYLAHISVRRITRQT